jgi:hypothetical protein
MVKIFRKLFSNRVVKSLHYGEHAMQRRRINILVSYSSLGHSTMEKPGRQPQRLVADTASFDQRYYDVALLPDGEVGVVWLDNRKYIGNVRDQRCTL